MQCYNYNQNYCTNYTYKGNLLNDSTFCNTACNNDPTCRASFTYRPQNYIDEGKNQKMCYHCSKQYDDQGIPIEPTIKKASQINDLNICYDISFNDLSDSEKQKCDWDKLSIANKTVALNNCEWNNLSPDRKAATLNNCEWNNLSHDKKAEIRASILSNIRE